MPCDGAGPGASWERPRRRAEHCARHGTVQGSGQTKRAGACARQLPRLAGKIAPARAFPAHQGGTHMGTVPCRKTGALMPLIRSRVHLFLVFPASGDSRYAYPLLRQGWMCRALPIGQCSPAPGCQWFPAQIDLLEQVCYSRSQCHDSMCAHLFQRVSSTSRRGAACGLMSAQASTFALQHPVQAVRRRASPSCRALARSGTAHPTSQCLPERGDGPLS